MLALYLSAIDDDGKRRTFEDIYRKHHDTMFAVALSLMKNTYDAEDALSNALLSIAKNIRRIKTDNEKMLKGYLCKVVKNSCLDILRIRRREMAFLNVDELYDLGLDEDSINRLEGDEQYKEIVGMILKMPPTYRDVLVFHYLHNLSPKEIACVLCRPRNTVRSQLTRGTDMLREILRKAGIK